MRNKFIDLLNIEREFFNNNYINKLEKLNYILKKYPVMIRNGRHIVFIGNDFNYDNNYTPLLLETYPSEIGVLNKATNLKTINTILDIGANIGQWTYVLKTFYPHILVHSIEPNPKIYPILIKNSKKFKNWMTFNFGIGDINTPHFLYYSGDGSAEASIYKDENSDQKVKVKLINLSRSNIKKHGLFYHYDLVKIDVEGAEKCVINSLKNLNFKYISLEVALKRNKGLTVNQAKKFLFKVGIKTKLITVQKISDDADAGNAIFKVKDN